MLGKSRFKLAIATGLLVVAVVAGAFWLLIVLGWFAPEATQFGWPVSITTVAGDGVRGHVDGASAEARFGEPFAVARDDKGILYVADAGDTGRIRRIDRDGNVSTLPGSFDTPSGLALDKAGNLFVAETGANRVRKISPDGAVTTLAGDGVAGFGDGPAKRARFNGPIGVAVDD